MSQLHQSSSRPPASPDQDLSRAITGIFDPLELTQTQTQLGTLAINESSQLWSVCMSGSFSLYSCILTCISHLMMIYIGKFNIVLIITTLSK